MQTTILATEPKLIRLLINCKACNDKGHTASYATKTLFDTSAFAYLHLGSTINQFTTMVLL